MMPRRNNPCESAASERLRAAFKASSVDGIWEWDHCRHVAVYDSGAAELLAGDAGLAERELAGEAAMAMVYPEDMAWLREQTVRAVHGNGLVLAEYRVTTREGEIRWILSRGRTEYRDGTPLFTRGILIDITQNRDLGGGYVVAPEHRNTTAAERIADHAIAMKRILGTRSDSPLALIVDMLLLEAGRELGREHSATDTVLQ